MNFELRYTEQDKINPLFAEITLVLNALFLINLGKNT